MALEEQKINKEFEKELKINEKNHEEKMVRLDYDYRQKKIINNQIFKVVKDKTKNCYEEKMVSLYYSHQQIMNITNKCHDEIMAKYNFDNQQMNMINQNYSLGTIMNKQNCIENQLNGNNT